MTMKDLGYCENPPTEKQLAAEIREHERPLKKWMNKYLEVVKKNGFSLDDRVVDWRDAAKRYAIFGLLMSDGKEEWGYGGIEGDIDCRMYESDSRAPETTILLTSIDDYRICRGGDCRGEPYSTGSVSKRIITPSSAQDLIDELDNFEEHYYDGDLRLEAFNGYWYTYEFGTNLIIREIFSRGRKFVETGNITCEIIKDENGRNRRKVISDTTHLFTKKPIQVKDMTEKEKEDMKRYSDDGRDEEFWDRYNKAMESDNTDFY